MSHDLFHDLTEDPVRLGDGALLLPRFAAGEQHGLLRELRQILASAPLRQMQTPGGYLMSVAMSCCGRFGWTSDVHGYRYTRRDPLSDRAWPAMPQHFESLAARAAAAAGYPEFRADACLINCYRPGAKLSPHQDKDERDLAQPIVSLSLGLPAVFQFGGTSRKERLLRTTLNSGDVVVWGGPLRLAYHGVLPLAPGRHPLTGECRYNLSFRRAE